MKNRPRWSLRAKLWISYLLVLIIPILFMAIFGYYWLQRLIDQESLSRHTAYLKDAIQRADTNFQQLDSLVGQLGQTIWITKLVNMQGSEVDRSRVSAWSLMEYQQFIFACQQSIPNLTFLGAYFPRKNLIISSRVNGNLDFLLHEALSAPWLTKEFIDERIEILKPGDSVYYAVDMLSQYGKASEGLLILKSVMRLPDAASPGAVLIAFIPRERILQAVDAALESSEFISLVINDDERSILKTDEKSIGGEKNSFAISLNSPVTGWQYELRVSRSALLRDIAVMRNILFLIVAGILLVCLIFSTFFSAWLYKPIKETLGLLSINTIYSGNELKQIKSSITLLKQQRDDLRDKMDEHSPLLVSYYYMALLLGPLQEREQAVAELQKMLPRPSRWYRVCILIQKTPRGIALATIPALRVQADLDKLDTPVTIQAINQSGRTLLILQYNGEDDFKHWMDSVLVLYPDGILAAGCAADSIAGLADSYSDANRICDFRLAQSGYRTLGVHTEAQGYYFPFETEADLMLALWTGNQTRAENLVKEILEKNANSKGSLDEVYRGLEHILRTVSNEIEAPPAIGELSENWIFQQAANICSARTSDTGKHPLDPKLLLEVVDSSIQNPNLSLQYVADRFDVSVSLISKAFKEIEGSGFNEYINRRRMEMAEKLIREGYEVLAAAKMVGYGNDTTFRRLFKAHTGMSPSEYRQKKQEGDS